MCRRGQKSTPGLLLAAGMLAGLMGCEDSVRHPVQVHPIQTAPPAVREFSPPPDPLPLGTIRGKTTPLVVFAPDGIEWLAARSQAAFDAGEQDFRAGHLEQARQEFDQALDQLLASGFDLDADLRLGDLYRHIVETANS